MDTNCTQTPQGHLMKAAYLASRTKVEISFTPCPPLPPCTVPGRSPHNLHAHWPCSAPWAPCSPFSLLSHLMKRP